MRQKFPDHVRLMERLCFVADRDWQELIPLSFSTIVDVLGRGGNVPLAMRLCGYSTADHYKLGFETVRHYLYAGYTVRDLLADDEALLYGLLATHKPTDLALFLRNAEDCVAVAGTSVQRELGIGLEHLLQLCRGKPHAAREVITKTMHVLDRGAVYGVPRELLDDCCCGERESAADGVLAIHCHPRVRTSQ
jgi:hypothetical protein